MLKRTLLFTQPYHISLTNEQLVIKSKLNGEVKQTPIEDLGFVVFEHNEITFTMPALNALAENNTAVVFCNGKHLPAGMVFPLDGHQLQNERFRAQTGATEPLKKQLWKQTVIAKIQNQATCLDLVFQDSKPEAGKPLRQIAKMVKSGDTSNEEGKAAKRYWNILFSKNFRRERFGNFPNSWLNYGYAILRAATARSLTGSGLLPTLGIHHHNKYNAYCLADDIMEPYRPYVDLTVVELLETYPEIKETSTVIKQELLRVLTADTHIAGIKRPLMIALSTTTASLADCFLGEMNKVKYPVLK